MTLLFSLVPLSASAEGGVVERTPDNNDTLRPFINAQFGLFLGGTAAGFIPEPISSLSGEAVAIATDASLKFTPPVFGRISDKVLEPNAPIGTGSSDLCAQQFTLQQNQAQHKNLFGFNFSLVPEEVRLGRVVKQGYWGPLVAPGEMTVFHQNSDVSVTLSGPGVDDDESNYPLMVSLPEGKHELLWAANTGVNVFWDIAFPVAIYPLFIYSEAKATSPFAKFFSDRKILKEIIDNPGNARFVDEAVATSIRSDITKTLLRALRGGALQESALLGGDVAIGEILDQTGLFEKSFARNSFTQTVTVLDIHTPTITTNKPEIIFEATDLGGTRLTRVYDELTESLEHMDVCKPTRVYSDAPNILPTGQTTVLWTTTDLEPGQEEEDYYKSGVSSTATVEQVVTVVDTQPPIIVAPAGKVLESADDVVDPAGADLGWPLVIDLADPAPVIANDAPSMFDNNTRLAVDWTATDSSGNAATQVQWVTAKSPGSNTPPSVAATNTSTQTAEVVDIRLDGIDADVLPTSRGFDLADPLSFEIVDYPENGQFEAPLRPFFIEDFRLTPVGETEIEGARTSPLGDNAAEFAALPDPADPRSANEQRGDFLQQRYCDQGLPIPLEFVFQPTYVHVADDGTYYVRDRYWDCANNDAYDENYPGNRISKWSKDREFLGEFRLDGLGRVPSDVFTVDSATNIWWTDNGPDFSAFLSAQDINKIDKNLQNYQSTRFSVAPEIEGFEYAITAVHADPFDGLIFVNDNVGIKVYRLDDREFLGRLSIAGEEKFLTPLRMGNSAACQQREPVYDGTQRRRYWMATDSHRNLYMSDGCEDLIHKFEPSSVDADGQLVAGDYVGWLGRCDTNIPPWNACDESTGVSRGFTCADNKCTRAQLSGTAPGQFQQPLHLAVDPNDVLYVADYLNARVQRFGEAGTFAGQAVSTGTGVNTGDDPGFVLGNMGQPGSVSVNSSSFFVMEAENDADFFLHSFKTIPFHMIDAGDGEIDQDGDGYADNSVLLKYRSDYNFPGSGGRDLAVERFSYRVNDGLVDSPVTQGTIRVRRTFRPPEQLAIRCYEKNLPDTQVPCSVNEDSEFLVELVAEDPDGVLGYDGLDTLTYEIIEAPGSGTLTLYSEDAGSAIYLYTPEPDYYGSDSFSYSVTDNTTIRRGGPVRVEGQFELTVVPVPDPPVVAVDAGTMSARGFPTTLTASYSDVDRDPDEPDPVVYVAWGDGSVEPQGETVQTSDDEYIITGPVLTPTVPGAGSIVASHTFLSDSSPNIVVCLDSVDSPLPVCETLQQEVVEATKTTALLVAENPKPPAGIPFTASLEVTNQAPEGWAGLDAPNIQATIDLPGALALVTADSRCSAGGWPVRLVCSVGDLAPGESVTLDMTLRTRIGVVPTPRYLLHAELEHDGFDIATEMTSDLIIEVIWIDTDADDLPDAWELFRFGSLAADPAGDSDNDGLSNLDEYFAGADPRLADTDADGKTDEEEYTRYLTDPSNPDTDGDGMPDAWEIDNGLDANWSNAQEDEDDDGLTNAQEYELGTDPTLADTDEDEQLDSSDNCPLAANKRQRDFDADTRGNACDPYTVVGLATIADVGVDGIDDLVLLHSEIAADGQHESWIELSSGAAGTVAARYPALTGEQTPLELRVISESDDPSLMISSERKSDGWPSISILHPLTGQLRSQINSLPLGSQLLATRALPQTPASSEPQLAVLLRDTVTGALQVNFVEIGSGVSDRLLEIPPTVATDWSRSGLEVLNIDGEPAVAVFLPGLPEQDVLARILIARIADGVIIADIQPETAELEALEMHQVPNPAGDANDDIAVRLRDFQDRSEFIEVYDLPGGNLLATVPVLGANPAAGDRVFNFSVIDTGDQVAMAVFAATSDALVVSVRDIVSGDELYKVPYTGSPSVYRNFNALLGNFDAGDTNELAAVMEDVSSGQHTIEVRDLQTGNLVSAVDAPTDDDAGGGGGAAGFWVLLFLATLVSGRRRLVRATAARTGAPGADRQKRAITRPACRS
ncbi:MAG: Ig-like domain-containing protein [Gammaproteobacteria bacterium]